MQPRSHPRRILAPALLTILLSSDGAEARSVGRCANGCSERYPSGLALLLSLSTFGMGCAGFWAWCWWSRRREDGWEKRALRRSRREGDRLTAALLESQRKIDRDIAGR